MTSFQEKMFRRYGNGNRNVGQQEQPTAAADPRERREAAVSEVNPLSRYGAAFIQAVADSPVYTPEHHLTSFPNPSGDHATGPIDHKRDHLTLDEAWARFVQFMADDPLTYVQSYTEVHKPITGKNANIRRRRASQAAALPKQEFSLTLSREVFQQLGVGKIHPCYLVMSSKSERGILAQPGHKLIIRPEWADTLRGSYMTAQVMANLGVWSVFEDLLKTGSTVQHDSLVTRYKLFSHIAPEELSGLRHVSHHMSEQFFDLLRGIEHAAGYHQVLHNKKITNQLQ